MTVHFAIYHHLVCVTSLIIILGVYYHLCSTSEFRGPGYMWRVIENNFPADLKEAVKGMRMCQDNKVSELHVFCKASHD